MSSDAIALQLLRSRAAELATETPVDVVAICQRLGLQLEVRQRLAQQTRGDRDHSKGALVEGLDGKQTVVVYRRTALYRHELLPYERIVVAHELAHYILLGARFPPPSGRAEYWSTERLCEDFAYWLLLGNMNIDLRAKPPRQVLAATLGIAHEANVTFKLAARAAVERFADPDVVIGDIEFSPLKTTKRIGFLLWLYNSSGAWLTPLLGRRAIYEGEDRSEFFAGFFDHPRSMIRQIDVMGLRDVALQRHVKYGAHFCATVERKAPDEP